MKKRLTIKIIKAVVLAIICICGMSSVSFASIKYHSFVDDMVDDPRLFEEDSADEFLAEKREINRMVLEKNFDSARSKLSELLDKTENKYGEVFFATDWYIVASRITMIEYEEWIEKNAFPYYNVSNYNRDELEKLLQDNTTWETISYYWILKLYNPDSRPRIGSIELCFKIAKKNFNLCVDILGESHPITLRHKYMLMACYACMGDPKTAIEIAEEILPQVEQVFGEKSTETSAVLSVMVYNYSVLGNYGKAEEIVLRAIDIDKELYGEENSPKLLNDILNLIYLKKVWLEDDLELYTALEKAAKNIPEDELYELNYFQAKAVVPFDNFDNAKNFSYAKLINLYNKILEVHWETFDKNSDPFILINYMADLFEISLNEKSVGLYQPALASDLYGISHAKRNFGNNHYITLYFLCNLSDDYLRLNQYEEALFLSQEALNNSRKIYGDEHPCTVYAIHSLTNVYRKQKRYLEALALDQRAEQICNKIFVGTSTSEPQEILIVKEDISNDYMGLKNYKIAIEYLNNLISEYMQKHKPIELHEFVNLCNLVKNLSKLYNLSGNYDKTVEIFDTVRKTLEQPLYGYAYHGAELKNVFGDALAFVGRTTEAFECYRDTIWQYETVRSENKAMSSEASRQRWFENFVPVYKKITSFFLAQNLYERAFVTLELCKGRTLADQYNDLIAMYNGDLSDEDISKLLESQKNIQQYKNEINTKLENINPNLKIDHQLHYLRMLEKEYEFKNLLQEKYPKYKALNYDKEFNPYKNFISEKRKQIVPQNSCYITFLIVKKEEVENQQTNKILACVANDDGSVSGFEIEVDNKLFDKCKFYHELLAYSTEENKFLWGLPDGNYKFTETRNIPASNAVFIRKDSQELREVIQQFSAELGDQLLVPLKDCIADKNNWIISPDGELNNIPFETLQFNGKMAVESANICYVPSFAVLKLMQDMKAKNDLIADRKEIFAMGSADYGDYGNTEIRASTGKFWDNLSKNPNFNVNLTQLKWKTLTKSKDELQKVSELFPTDRQEIIMGINASERNLKDRDKNGQLAQYKYLLFSTHGIFIQEKPELSSIVLTQVLNDENYDGYVTVGELFGYNLNSNLVYLSACESGLGAYQAGEGIVGIPYALTVAGNKDTVMSLWKIREDVATEFTATFFRKLKEGRTEIQALNESKREFLSSQNPQFNNPASWSAFLLYGI